MIDILNTTLAFGVFAVSAQCTVLYTYDLILFVREGFTNRSS
jgi:hypothetical protein